LRNYRIHSKIRHCDLSLLSLLGRKAGYCDIGRSYCSGMAAVTSCQYAVCVQWVKFSSSLPDLTLLSL
jgi:hypothetical protein